MPSINTMIRNFAKQILLLSAVFSANAMAGNPPNFQLSTTTLTLQEDFGSTQVTVISSDDGDGTTQTLTYSLSVLSTSFAELSIDPQTGTLTITSLQDAFGGPATVTVTLADSSGHQTTQSVRITVLAVPDPPMQADQLIVGTFHSFPFTTRPFGIAIAPDGRVFVSGFVTDQLYVSDGVGALVRYTNAASGDFETPARIGLSTDGRIFVANANTDIFSVVDNNGSSITTYFGNVGLDGPEGIAVAPDGRVFVADTFNHRILVISADGSTISTYAGSTDGSVFLNPTDMALAPDGRLFVADSGRRVIRVISADGSTVSLYAGVTAQSSPGIIPVDELVDSAASDAVFAGIAGLALAPDGRLFVTDLDYQHIRVISADGSTVSVYAGSGASGSRDGLASTARFNQPRDVAFTSDGRVLVTDFFNDSVRVIARTAPQPVVLDPVSVVVQEAGEELLGADSVQSLFQEVDGDTLTYSIIAGNSSDGTSTLFVIDSLTGALTLGLTPSVQFAGSTYTLTLEAADDDGAATATVVVRLQEPDNYPPSFTLSTTALTLAEDFGTAQIAVVDSADGDSDVTQTLTYSISSSTLGFATLAIDPQSGTLTITSVDNAFGVATITVTVNDGASVHNRAENLLTLTVTSVPDPIIRNVNVSRVVSTYIGTGSLGTANGPALQASIGNVFGLALHDDGRLFFADFFNDGIRVISADGSNVSVHASGASQPLGLEFASDGRLFFSSVSNRIFVLGTNGGISRYAGSGGSGFFEGGFVEGDSLDTAEFNRPTGLALTTDGRVFVADQGNHRIRVISADGSTVSTYAGSGTTGVSGGGFADGDSLSTAQFDTPSQIVRAPDGRFFVADSGNHRIRVISADGSMVSTYAGSGSVAGFADGSTSTARFSNPRSIALAADGRLFVADTGNHRIRVISADGSMVSTYAGNGQAGLVNGPIEEAVIENPGSILLAADGRLFIATTGNGNQFFRLIETLDSAQTYSLSGSEQFVGAQIVPASFFLGLFTNPDSDSSLIYSFQSGNDQGLFSINSADGSITLNALQADLSQATTYNLVVATDNGGGATTTTIIIQLSPLDNYAPSFTLSHTALSLIEDFGSAQITVLNSDDGDLDVTQTLTYSISSSNPGLATLAIDPQSGTLTITSVDNVFGVATITVTVNDNENFNNIATQTVSLALSAVNDPPNFSLSTNVLTVAEDFSTIQVTVLSSDDGDGTTQAFTYSISTTNVSFATLTINTQSGAVTINSVANAFGQATIHVIADDGGAIDSRSTQSFTLTVNNVNDAPNFALSTAALSLAEDFGSTQVTVASSDDGDGTSQSLSYSISSSTLGFATLVIDPQSGTLTITSVDNAFGVATITVTVDDSSATNNYATQVFTLKANSVNDAPRFVLSSDALILDENFATTAVVVISSDDGDGTTQTLSYSISTTDVGFATLLLDGSSGRVTLTSVLDAFGIATVTITADDGAAVNSISTQLFTVRAIERNGQPSFTLSTTAISVDEDFSSSVQVVVLSSDDGDLTANQVLTYSISPTNTNLVGVSIDAQSGTVTLTSVADAFGVVTFFVVVDDASATNSMSTQSFTLTVRAVDDVGVNDPPLFMLSTTALTLDEDFGTAQVQISSSTDGDGTSQTLTYSISTTDVGFATLSIDINSGTVTLTSVADAFGTATVYVVADDSSEVNNLSTQSFVLTVHSVNDAPIFTLSTTALTLDEDFGSVQVFVSSSDADGIGQTIVYSLSSTNVGVASLSIDAQSGTITLVSNSNAFGTVSVTVIADDGAAVNSQSTQLLVFAISPLNDAPIALSSATVRLSSAQQVVGALVVDVATIQALFIDVDNSTLSYAITAGNADGLFAIGTSGSITLATIPQQAQASTQVLTVTADDGALSASTTLHIGFEPLNNYSPMFTLSVNSLALAEDFGSTQVAVINSSDGDVDVVQTLVYSISTTNIGFATLSIGSTSGLVVVTSVQDASGSTQTITVVVDDGGLSNNRSTQIFSIVVAAVNDVPVFTLSTNALTLDEGFGISTEVRVTSISDVDNATSVITYAISTSDVGFATLAISSLTGAVALSSVADLFGMATITITADDNANGLSTQVFTLVVNSVNSTPTFELSTSAITLSEDFITNAAVFAVNADDGDAAVAQTLTYSISTTNIGFVHLTINSLSGTITLTSIADAFGTATITVTVDDSSDTSNQSTQAFVLKVLAVDNDPPQAVKVIQRDVSTYAGSGIAGSANGSAAIASFRSPTDVAFAPDGRLFVADANNHRIRVISADGLNVSNYAGSGVSGSVDGLAADAQFVNPRNLAVTTDGRVLVSDNGAIRIRVISADGSRVDNYAGTGFRVAGGTPDDGTLLGTAFHGIDGLALAPDGRIVIAENGVSRLLLLEGNSIRHLSGSANDYRNGTIGSALYDNPRAMAFMGNDVLFIADAFNHAIRKLDFAAGVVSLYAGRPEFSSTSVVDGAVTDATFPFARGVSDSNESHGLAVAADGRLFIADPYSHRVRVIDSSGQTISTYAGGGPTQFQGPTVRFANGEATQARFNLPQGIAISTDGRVFVADTNNHRIRLIEEAVLNEIPSELSVAEQVVGAQVFASTLVQQVLYDPDGNASYSIIDGNADGLFTMDPQSGAITLAAVPSGLQIDEHTLIIQASDDVGTATTVLTVRFEYVNSAPSFSLSTTAVTLDEDFSSIVNVMVTDSDDNDVTVTQVLTYSVSDVDFADISIDPNTGLVAISSITGQFGVATVYVVADEGADVNSFSTQSFVLTVHNINDPPIFTLSATVLTLDEDFSSVSVTVASSNNGDGTSQTLTYSISTSDVGFATLSIDGSGTVSISSVENSFGVATVYVVADDSSAVNNLSTQSFVLSVVSVNDPPEFNLSAATLVVDEEFGRVSVTVTDSNDGDGLATTQVLSYSISTENVGFAILSIDAQSGVVTIDSVVDGFGVATVYVVADDSSAANNLSTQSFVLTVNNVNDAPIFTLSTAAVVLDEDFTTTQTITVASSDDGDDDGVSQPLIYSLSAENVGFATLSIDGSGTVSINSVANGFGVATVTVTLTDGLVDSLSTQSFVLTVNNVNDAPNFALSTAALSLAEDFGSTQVTVASSDDGDGTSQPLNYSLSTSHVGFAMLLIDGSGTVSISSVADAFGTATIYVVADDGGSTDSRSTQSFVLTVNAVNDAPSFTLSTAAVVLDEDFATTQAISVVSSDDGDVDGVTQTLNYSLSTSHVGFAMLSVDDDSGTVSISSVADGFGVATVYVVADDSSAANNLSTQSFVLTVNNVNDAPNFALSTAALSLAEDFGSTQVTVISSDDGDGTSQSLSYSLSTSHVGFATLLIDGSGTVSISSVENSFGVATVYVVADDSSAVNNLSTQSFVLTVNAVNDAPIFALSTTAVVLDEDFATTQAISVASSDDGDVDGVTQTLSYSLSTSHVGFATLSIDAQSGVVTIDSVVDGFGVATVYVVADDSSAANNLSTQSFVLTVNNVNDAPIFTLSTAAVVLDEDFTTTQITVASSDDGDGTTQSLSYSLSTSHVGFAMLSVDGSGTVSISSVADAFGTATIYVVADDGGDVYSRSTQSFVLTVNAVNDAPSFTLSAAAVVLDEDFATTQAISVVSIADGDIDGVTQTVIYSLSTSHVGFAMLSVDSSGTVSISSVEDGFGVATVYVVADDGGTVDSRSTQSFTLTVNSVNDAPSFALSTAALSLAEDFGSTQVTVASSDDGDGTSQPLSYSISTTAVGFATLSISTQSGTITIASVANGFGVATVTVTVNDSSAVNALSTQVLAIVVNAVNDAPVFTLSTSNLALDENFATVTVTITDANDGDVDGVTQALVYSLNTSVTNFARLSISSQTGEITISSILNQSGGATVYVIADDGGSVNSSATRALVLSVGEVNGAPNFTLSTTALILDEDFASTQITVVSSDDGDGTTQVLTYSVSSTDTGFALLTIDADSGTLTITSVADAFGAATITVTVDDGADFDSQFTQAVRVVVNAVNEVPSFVLSATALSLAEDFGSTQVTVTSSDDGDAFIAQILTYSLSTTDVGFAMLSIDNNSGEITLTSVDNAFGVATVMVTVDDSSATANTAVQTVVVTVQSVNDAPIFALSTTAVILDEDFATTQAITVASSDDGDGTSQPLSYSISTTDVGFATLSIDSNSGEITLTSVDNAFGVATVYVVADDSGDVYSRSTQSFVLTVNSVNDAPSFTLSTTAVVLDEDFATTEAITIVSSADGDGTTQTLTYSISTTAVGFATLSVNGSGTVTITSVADAFGVATVYVVADDGGDVYSRSTQSFVLTVNAVNDAPSFTLSTTAVVLDEDFATTEAITVASSDDVDSVTQTLSYSLSTSHVGFATLSVDSSGAVSINSVPDAFGVAIITVTADDGGSTDSRSTQSFVLTVNAVNDAPIFSLSTAAVTLDEDFSSAQIMVASSADGDGTTQTLTYSISTTAVGFATLSVDGSGTVSISSVADAFGVATVTVTVDDGGAVDNLAMQSFVLTVNSVNDAPNFALSTAALTLDEDFGSTQVTVVSSDDGDGTTQTLTYSISTENVGFAMLSVGSSGTVRISSVADAFGVATVTVTVNDGGAVDSRSTQSFVLTVNSVNDAPSFTLSTAALSLAEDFGSTQVTVTSSDDGDDGEDQLLSYSLSSSNVGFATLSVDGSGTVSIRSVANGFGVATVTVTVDDRGAVDNLAMQSFVLTVNAVNDAPNFTLSTSALVLDEGFGLRQVSVLSSDDGDGTNQVLTYSLSTTDTGFAELSISSQTGVITINSIANQNGGATVYVTADDGGSVNSSATRALVLSVGSVNGAPNFTLSTTDLTLDEDFGSVQVTVLSSDDGDGTNQVLTYSVSVSTAALGVATADIDADSGALTIASVANAFGMVTVTVTVDDGAEFNSQSTQAVRVVVNAVNEVPSFVLSATALSLAEDFGSAQVTVISSDDGDAFIAQILSYSISTTDVGFATLSIDSNSGEVTLTSVADAFGVATVMVTVDDSSATANTAVQTVVVTVQSVNDAPSFTLSTTAISVREDFGSVEVTVASSDDGDGGIQTLRYSLSTANVGFATLLIDADSGAITLSSVADGFGAATVTVTVDDGSIADNIATQELSLTVVEIVDGLMASTSLVVYVGGLHTPEHVLVLSDGRLLVADSGNHVIYEVVSQGGSTGSATVYAGSEGASGNVNGGSASEARFSAPVGLALASDGRVLVADRDNNSIRVISADGSAVADYATDGLDAPIDLAWATDGRLFVADSGNNRIAVISADGSAVTDYATGLNSPQGISLASDGRLFVADSGNSRVAVISADGNTVSTYAGAGEGDADGSVATALLGQPQGVVIAGRTVFVADTNNDLLRVVDVSASTVSTFAGLAGSEVVLDAPVGVGISTDGRQVFVADQNNARIVVAQTGNALPTITLSTANISLSAGFADFTITVSAMDEGSPLSWQVTVEDNTVLTATNNASGITLSSVANQTGSARLTVHAMDDLGAMVYRTIEVTVEEAAEPPAPEPAAGGGGGGGCSLHAATGASDWTLWLLLLLSLLALRLRPRYL